MKIIFLVLTFFSLALMSCRNNTTISKTNQKNETKSLKSDYITKRENTQTEYLSPAEKKQTVSTDVFEKDKDGLPIFTEKDKSKEIFASCFSGDLPAYDFIIRNPMIPKKVYIEKIDSVKNKILKIEHEDYDFRNGVQVWNGDDEEQSKIREYYMFDSEGHISDYYFINKTENEKSWIYKQEHTRYHCTESQYFVCTSILVRGNKRLDETEENVYMISKDVGTVTLTKSGSYQNNSKFRFNNNTITNIYGFDLDSKNVYDYSGPEITLTKYSIPLDGKKNEFTKQSTFLYDRGLLIKSTEFTPNGFRISSYKLNGEEGSNFFYEESNGEIKSETTFGYVCAKYNEAGFIEKFRQDPLTDTSSGAYVFEDSELLDAPDDVLKEYFGVE